MSGWGSWSRPSGSLARTSASPAASRRPSSARPTDLESDLDDLAARIAALSANRWFKDLLADAQAAFARAARQTSLVNAIAWLHAHADTYRNAPPARTGNAVSYVETLRQDMPVFMDGLADLLAHLLTEGALDRRMARR
jgi:outer membrane murein-binding lipoprotein Lpp